MASVGQPGCANGPQIAGDPAPLEMDRNELPDECVGVALAGAQLSNTNVAGLILAQSRLTNVDFTESRLGQLHASDVEFVTCNLSAAHLPGASLLRVLFERSKLSGIQVAKSSIVDVTFAIAASISGRSPM
jgi:uncharacterized protein YjbI with pentapeptide repeats